MDETFKRMARTRRPDCVLAAIAGAIALAVVAALILTSPPAEAAFPGENGRIACGGLRGVDDDAEIFDVNPDGTDERLLTNNGYRDGSPAYSPDGSKIAFEARIDNVVGQPANTEIYVADNDGDLSGPDVRRLTFNNGTLANGTLNSIAATDFSPSWSPDGTEIVFHSGRLTTFDDGRASPATDFEIYKMSATEGESRTPATRLTYRRGQDAIPSWSPDGTKIAWQGFPAGNPANLPVNLEIWTMDPSGMNPDGTGATNVSNNPGNPNVTTTAENDNHNGIDRFVIWSSDSTKLAYSSTRAATVLGNQNEDVWVANRDGSNPTRLTVNPDSPAPGPLTDYDVPLVWSPDGKEILFSSSRGSTLTNTDFFAYRMDATAGEAGGVQRVVRHDQFQRCDWTSPRPAVTTPPISSTDAAPAADTGTTTAPTITASGGVVTADRAAPGGRLLFTRSRIRRGDLLDRNGLGVPARIDEGGTVLIDMYVDNGAALPRLPARATQRPRLTLVARGRATRPTAGRATVRVRPTRAGRSRLRRTPRTRVILVATLRDRAGNQRRLPRHRAAVVRR